MFDSTPYLKRIKRHVTGRRRNYFIAVSPGLESHCRDELLALPLSISGVTVVPGGVGFDGRLINCYAANLNLRIANRILMRAGDFNATNFRQLEKKLRVFPWELFLGSTAEPVISVTSRESRLYHKAAIQERVVSNIAKRFSETLEPKQGVQYRSGNQPSYRQLVFVRLLNDHCTISIDSSGENLYKRGQKQHGHKAPLRETIAAAVLKIAGYSGREPLIDPMCGSGTFSLEGAMVAKGIPPGWYRRFAFMDWPSFAPKQWEHMKKEAEKCFIQISPPFIMASDKDKKACQVLENNLQALGWSDTVKVSCQDFFDFSPSDIKPHSWPTPTGLVVINPPYGHRLGTKKESEKLLSAIFDKLKQDYKGWKIAVLTREKKIAKHFHLKLTAHPLFHGGLRLTLLIGRIDGG